MEYERSVEALAKCFKRWGRMATRRILSLTKKHGVLCSATNYSNGKKG